MATGTHAAPGAGFDAAFVAAMLDDALAHGPCVHGIGGLQGSGKSTLARQMAALGERRGLSIAVLSIDDAYLDHEARAALGRDVHPLLATRGPPGTHDVDLACTTLDALRAGRPVALPRFDKLGDRHLPVSTWPRVGATDLVLFEGWFLATPPEPESMLASPVNALERDEDPDSRWRRHCNAALGRDYPPLWQRIDRLLWLQAPGFDVVPRWRWQQERALQAANPGRAAMGRAGIDRFVQFFERTSRQALRTLPGIADRMVELDAARRPRTAASGRDPAGPTIAP